MKSPINITKKEHVDTLLANYDNFLFDCDGVVWLDEKLIPGMLETIRALKHIGKKFAFITNNSSKSRMEYVAKFQRLGFEGITEDMIYPTCYAAVTAVKEDLKIPKGSKIWVLGDDGIEQELKQEDYVPVGGTNPELDQNFDHNHPLLKVDPDVKAVIVGSTKRFNYMRIALTLQYLLHNDKSIPFIGTNIDRSYPGPDGLILPAGGSVVNYMAYTADRDFINVGKPSTLFLDTVLKHQKFERSRTVMVGDTLYTDIKFGNDGCLGGVNGGSILVLTGGTKSYDLTPHEHFTDDLVPSYIINSFGEVGQFVNSE